MQGLFCGPAPAYNSPMEDLPKIITARTTLTLLRPQDAALLRRYVTADRAHLAPWEPQRDDAFYTPATSATRWMRHGRARA